jgi:hypothetical protein
MDYLRTKLSKWPKNSNQILIMRYNYNITIMIVACKLNYNKFYFTVIALSLTNHNHILVSQYKVVNYNMYFISVDIRL